MTDPQLVLTERVQQALAAAFGAEYAGADPLIRPSTFADYQANVALAWPSGSGARRGRSRRRSPRHLDAGDACRAPSRSAARASSTSPSATTGSPPQAAGAARRPAPRGRRDRPAADGRRRLLRRPTSPRRCTSATCARPSSATRWRGCWSTSGNTVIRAEPPGRLGHAVRHADRAPARRRRGHRASPSSRPARSTRSTRRRGPSSTPTPPSRSGHAHAGGRRCRPATRRPSGCGSSFIDATIRYFNKIYQRLGVTLTDDDLAGESFYNSMLAERLRRARSAPASR